MPRIFRPILCSLLLPLAVVSAVRADDDGELFPNVKSYDDVVQAPISKPDKALEKPKPVVDVTITPPTKQPKPQATPAPTDTPATPVAPPKPVITIHWHPYRNSLLTPLLSADSEARFEKEFSPKLKANLKQATDEKAKAAQELWKEAEAGNIPADLKRVLWLHALGLSIKGQTKLEERAEKARAVLPLLQEETLPAAQARADAVTELAFGALSNASDALLAIVMESQCKLARMQVQGGFPDEANNSMKVAREAFRYIREKTEAHKNTLAEATGWVDRANVARASSSKWQQTLSSKPNDPFINTQLATLNLSLYGDVDKAVKLAAKSDRKEFQAFAAAIDAAKKSDPQSSVPGALKTSEALLALAETAVSLPFDRYSIAALVEKKLAEATATGGLEEAQSKQAATFTERAEAIIGKSGFHQPSFNALEALATANTPATAKTGAPASTGPADKLVLFVKDNGTVVKYVKPTPKQDAEAIAMARALAKEVGEKINVKFVEVEMAHCLIFTTWKPEEHGFLKKNVEGAYAAAAKLFDFPLNENIFPGKLPCFMMATQAEFKEFGREIAHDDWARVLASFQIADSGLGYMVTYQRAPDMRHTAQDCVSEWGRGVSWNMTFAFMARYRTNKDLPRWAAQGLPARVSFSQFAAWQQRTEIRYFLDEKKSISALMTNGARGYQDEAVLGSVVDMLIAKNPKAFVTLINKLKDGEEAVGAFKETYKMSYDDVDKLWRTTWVNRP